MFCCGLARIFRRDARVDAFKDAVDSFVGPSAKPPSDVSFLLPSEPQNNEDAATEPDILPSDSNVANLKIEVTTVGEKHETLPETPHDDRAPGVKGEKPRRHAPPFFRNFFKSIGSIEEDVIPWIRIEFTIDKERQTVTLAFKREDDAFANKSIKGTSSPTSTIQSLFRIRGRKPRDEAEENIRPTTRQLSHTSAKQENAEDEANNGEITTNRPRSVFCFGWGQTGVIDDGDEAIAQGDGAVVHPQGLVGLLNLGNTCFLNAALQCLRCTPGLAELIVPEIDAGLHDTEGPKRTPLSYSSAPVRFYRMPSSEWTCVLVTRSSSLPSTLPYELGGWLQGDMGLAGGSLYRLASVPSLDDHPPSLDEEATSVQHRDTISNKNAEINTQEINDENQDFMPVAGQSEKHPVITSASSQGTRDQVLPSSQTPDLPFMTEPGEEKEEEEESNEEIMEKRNDDVATTAGKKTTPAEKQPEIPLSPDFITAFQKLVIEVCLGEAENHWSPRDLYLQLKKLPQGEWFCDGGQHDCQEILRVLLDAVHATTSEKRVENGRAVDRDVSSVSSVTSYGEMDEAEQIVYENMKADHMWRRYLFRDSSPITDVFAGQLQIVRTCQKCTNQSTTYEPFWDLSLSLSREKPSWFNPGRMPSSLDELLKAFTAAEVLQGDEAPFCDCCQEKSSATRRILIHRFPKVLVINIKRFKYTKDGREKLTSNIAFPVQSLELQSFASREHSNEGIKELYDLYAVSNHYGTLGGGHYTAFCKIRDRSGNGGWYSFNDKVVTKIGTEAVVTPHAYILFYSKRPIDPSIDLDATEVTLWGIISRVDWMLVLFVVVIVVFSTFMMIINISFKNDVYGAPLRFSLKPYLA